MRTRDTYLSDYGITQKEADETVCLCRCCPDKRETLHKAAVLACPDLADFIELSILRDVSFDRISKIVYIPIKRDDFYGYRRKAVAIAHEILQK